MIVCYQKRDDVDNVNAEQRNVWFGAGPEDSHHELNLLYYYNILLSRKLEKLLFRMTNIPINPRRAKLFVPTNDRGGVGDFPPIRLW